MGLNNRAAKDNGLRTQMSQVKYNLKGLSSNSIGTRYDIKDSPITPKLKPQATLISGMSSIEMKQEPSYENLEPAI